MFCFRVSLLIFLFLNVGFSGRRWSRTIGDKINEIDFTPRRIISTSNPDDFVIVGLMEGYYESGHSIILKVNKDGVVWSKRSQSAESLGRWSNYPGYFSVAEVSDGFLAVGSAENLDNYHDTTVLKLKKNGDLVYQKVIENGMEGRSVILRKTPDDNCDVYLAGGYFKMYKDGYSFIYCFNSKTGNVFWGSHYPPILGDSATISYRINDVVETNDGEIVAIGTNTGTESSMSYDDEIIIFLLNETSNGFPLWTRSIEHATYAQYKELQGLSILVSEIDGNLIIAGRIEGGRAFVGKLRIADGTTIWMKKFLVDEDARVKSTLNIGLIYQIVEDQFGNIAGIGNYFFVTPHGDEPKQYIDDDSHIFVFNITSTGSEINWVSSTYFVPTAGIDKGEYQGHVPSDVGVSLFILDDEFLVGTGVITIEDEHSYRTFFGVISRKSGGMCNDGKIIGQHNLGIEMKLEDLSDIVNIETEFSYSNLSVESFTIGDGSGSVENDIPDLEFKKRCNQLHWYEIFFIVLGSVVAVVLCCYVCCGCCCCLLLGLFCITVGGLSTVSIVGGGGVFSFSVLEKKDSASGDNNDDNSSSGEDEVENPPESLEMGEVVTGEVRAVESFDFQSSKDFQGVDNTEVDQNYTAEDGVFSPEYNHVDRRREVDGYDVNPSAPAMNDMNMGFQMNNTV